MTIFQNAFPCRTLWLCRKHLEPRLPLQGCWVPGWPRGGLTWWRWGLGVPAAAGRGMPGCLRGQGELPGASRDSQGPKLSCRVDTNPLRDNVSSGYHSGSCSAAEAFHWEMQHQKSMLLDSKWLWNSCTGAAK